MVRSSGSRELKRLTWVVVATRRPTAAVIRTTAGGRASTLSLPRAEVAGNGSSASSRMIVRGLRASVGVGQESRRSERRKPHAWESGIWRMLG